MKIIEDTVILRHIVPAEGKVIKRIDPEEWYPEGLYLGKDEDESNYIEVDASEMPVPEPPKRSETPEQTESEANDD